MPIHEWHEMNSEGRDFVVGDLHGCYTQLMSKLEAKCFDFQVDRLFSVGDLIDRGEESMACLSLADEPWFFPVSGNHEDMLLDVFRSDRFAEPFTSSLYLGNGGAWFYDISPAEKKDAYRIISALPYARTIITPKGKIGIVHAAWGWSWERWHSGDSLTEDEIEYALWARLNDKGLLDTVPDVTLVISGHQNEAFCRKKGNQVWIDTIGVTGKLTLTEIHTVVSAMCQDSVNITL